MKVSSWRREGEAGVSVADTGSGISAEALPHVFDRFYRAGGARIRDNGGSGLGLAISQEIAVTHGGRLWVESQAGHGSCFSLVLPAGADSISR